VVIEICVKYPGGPTRNRGTDILNEHLGPAVYDNGTLYGVTYGYMLLYYLYVFILQ
jgi:hypothetical protein